MREHPEKIEQISLEIADLNERLQSLRERIGKHEALMTLEIVTAKDEQGKALYPNESLRSAALVLSKDNSAELQSLIAEERETERRRAETFARLERLRLEFKLFLLDRQDQSSAFNQ
jgi:seryl-tRNA(Sec) selenium transferase